MQREPSFYILLFVASFLIGIAYSSFLPIGDDACWFVVMVALAVTASYICLRILEGNAKAFTLKIGALSASIVIIITGLLVGVWRFDSAYHPADSLAPLRDSGEVVELTGTIVDESEPATRGFEYVLRVDGGDRVLFYGPHTPRYEYGDRLELEGEIVTPEVFEDFNYPDFLKKEGILSISYRPELNKIGEDGAGSVYATILSVKGKMRDTLYTAVPSPYADVLSAMTLGDKFALSDELGELFSRAGIRHIVAISGMHIAIITALLISLLIGGFGLRQSSVLWIAGSVLAIYITLIGAPASAVRAGIMAGLLLLGKTLGRAYASTRALIIAGFLMLLINPLLLRFDAGFQLSFLAIFGIIYISPLFDRWLRKVPIVKYEKLRAIISMTLSAQLATLPLVAHTFGTVSIAAPLVNVLVVPVVAVLLALGFAGILLGAIFHQLLGTIILYPAYLLVVYIMGVSQMFDRLPASSLTEVAYPWWAMVISYAVLIVAIYYLRRRTDITGEGESSLDALVKVGGDDRRW